MVGTVLMIFMGRFRIWLGQCLCFLWVDSEYGWDSAYDFYGEIQNMVGTVLMIFMGRFRIWLGQCL